MNDIAGIAPAPVGGLAGLASSRFGEPSVASATDVQRFEQAMQRGVGAPVPAPEAVATEPAAASAPERLGDAILGTLNRLSSLHHDTHQRVGQVLSAPDSEFTSRRVLEVQAALNNLSVSTQLVANVTTQVARVVDQTAKMQ